jgi:ATP-binding cassette subfamily B protein
MTRSTDAPGSRIHPDRSLSWLRRALPLIAEHRVMFGAAIAGAFVALWLQVEIPTVIGLAIDHALVKRTSTLTPFLLALAGLGVGRWALNALSRTLLLRTAYQMEFDIRSMLYAHLTRLSFSFYDRVQTGELMARSNSDVRSLQMYLATAPVIIAQCAVAAVVFVQMLVVNPILALVAMSAMPFVAVVGVRVRRQLFPASWLVQARLAQVATTVDESTNGVRVVKSFAAERRQVDQLALDAKRAEWASEQDTDIRGRSAPVLENLPRMGQALLLLVGGYLAYRGSVTIGTLVAFNAYILLLQPPFRQLGLLVMLEQRAKASAQRIYAVLDTEPEIVDADDAIELDTCAGFLQLRDVRFAYAGASAPVLDGFDFEVRPGVTTALVGRSGSGKSTVARLIARYYDVDAGDVCLDGHDVRRLTTHSLRRQVGIVSDEPYLFSMSIRDNIAFGDPDAQLDSVVAAAKAAGAHEFIVELPDGYDTVIGERGYTLSGGQRQRLAIARSLLPDPPVLILDDATSAIDAQVEARIHRVLRETFHQRTTVIIGHRIASIRLADRIALLEGGRIVASGTHEELVATSDVYNDILASVLTADDDNSDDGSADAGATSGVDSGAAGPSDSAAR